MKKLFLGVLLGLGLMFIPSTKLWAGEVDVLLDVLVQKGYLTPTEASLVRDETKQKVKSELAAQQSYAVPEWVQKMRLKGDFRLRYQYERRQNTTDARTRGRLRYRLGLETDMNKTTKVGVGFASGGADPRSTNQTFQDSFQHPDLRLDYAFAEWTPSPDFKMAGGKFKFPDYLWTPDDLLWDTDINPEGGSVHWQHDIMKDTALFLNSGVWLLDENSTIDKADPYMVYAQAGLGWTNQNSVEMKNDIYPNVLDAKVAGIVYNFNSLEGICPDWDAGTNTGLTAAANSSTGACGGGTLAYDYDSVGGSGEFGISNPFGSSLERVALFGDYIFNIDPESDNIGWALGAKFGYKKLINRGNWQVKYQYSLLGKDAFIDFTPDSDRLGGATNILGHEIELQYVLNKNVIFGLDYYHDQILKGARNPNDLVQADMNFKF